MANVTGADIMNQSFSTFTGADIQAVIGYINPGTNNYIQRIIGTLSSITISVVRETNPIWTMGDPNWRAVAVGKRSISGTLTFSVFDRDPLVRDIFAQSLMQHDQPQAVNATNYGLSNYGLQASTTDAGNAAANVISGLIAQTPRNYADQLPLFDITVSMTNQDASSMMAVRQIKIVSQGEGYSIHDMENDKVYSYIARYAEPLTPIQVLANANSGSWAL